MLSNELLAHYRRLSHQPLTVVDVETTGYRADRGRVIEVSVLHASLKDGIFHQQTHLINPGVRIPAPIVRFTGISQAMVDAAASSAEVWPQYLPFLNQNILTAHNLAFDYSFLQAEYRHLGICFSRLAAEQLCTVTLARLMLPDLPSRSLPDLVQHFQFPVGHSHRAEAGTLACWLLTERLLTDLQTEADETLLARFAQEWLPLYQAAKILNCSQSQAQHQLKAAGVEPRQSHRSGTLLYRRGAVETVFWRSQGQQLFLGL